MSGERHSSYRPKLKGLLTINDFSESEYVEIEKMEYINQV